MAGIFIKNIDYNLLVIGPIYDKLDQLSKINRLAEQYKIVILNSGLCFSSISNIERNVNDFRSSVASNVIYNLGGDDLKYGLTYDTMGATWIKSQSNAIVLEFKNQTSTIVVNGGVTPKMKKDCLNDNLELAFVAHIDGKPWHNKYYGSYGYIISNNPLTTEKPKFYPFSMQMGNKYELSQKTYVQEISPWGLKKTFLL